MYSQQTEREKRVHHFFDSIDLLFDLRKRMALDFINLHAQNNGEMGKGTIDLNNLSFENQSARLYESKSERVSEWTTEQNEEWTSRKEIVKIESQREYIILNSNYLNDIKIKKRQNEELVNNENTFKIENELIDNGNKNNLLVSEDFPSGPTSQQISNNSSRIKPPIDPRILREGKRLQDQKVFGEVHNFKARKDINLRASAGSNIYLSDPNKMINIEYYDQYLNMERKMCHLLKVVGKIRLRKIQKPFMILDMLELINPVKPRTKILLSLIKEMIQLRKRQAIDSIVDYVEMKKQIKGRWAKMTTGLLALRKKQHWREIEIRKRQEHRNKRSGVKRKRGVKLMGSILGCLFRDMTRSVFEEIIVFGAGRAEFGKKSSPTYEIEEQQDFLKEKADREMRNGNLAGRLGGEETTGESKKENRFEGSFGNRQNQMNAYYNPDSKKRGFESSFEMIDPNRLTNDINAKMALIQKALKDEGQNENESLGGFEGGMESLTHLTQLMQMLKKYFEQVKHEGEGETEKAHRAKFQQVLKMLKQLINLILAKMSNTHASAFASQRSEQTEEPGIDHENPDSNMNSHRLIEELQIQLNKEMEDIHQIINSEGYNAEQEIPETTQQEEEEEEEHFPEQITSEGQEGRINTRTTFGHKRTGDLSGNEESDFQRRESNAFGGTEQDVFKSGQQSQNTDGYQSVGNFNNMLEEITEKLFNLNMNLEQGEAEQENEQNTDTKNSNFNSFENGQQMSQQFSSRNQADTRKALDDPQFEIFNQERPKNLSFRKKFAQNQSEGYEIEGIPEAYSRPEFFNFYGVLNFKVRKYNRKLLKEAFEEIFERSVDFESRLKVFACGQLIKKDRFFMDLERLKNEVNRRNFIRKNTIFKLFHAQNMKRSEVLHAMRFNRENPMRPEEIEYNLGYNQNKKRYNGPDMAFPQRRQVQSQVPLPQTTSHSMYNQNVMDNMYNDNKFPQSMHNNYYPPHDTSKPSGNMFYQNGRGRHMQSHPEFENGFGRNEGSRQNNYPRHQNHRLMQTTGNLGRERFRNDYGHEMINEEEYYRQGKPAPGIPSLQNQSHYDESGMGYYNREDNSRQHFGHENEMNQMGYEDQGNYNPFDVYEMDQGVNPEDQFYRGDRSQHEEYIQSQMSIHQGGNLMGQDMIMNQQGYQEEQMEGMYREDNMSHRPESQHQMMNPGGSIYDQTGNGDLRIGSGTQRPMMYSQRQTSKLSLRNDYGMGQFPGSGDAYSVKSLQQNMFMNRTEDDCLYMNLEEEYLHKVSKRQKRDNSISINKSMQDYQ